MLSTWLVFFCITQNASWEFLWFWLRHAGTHFCKRYSWGEMRPAELRQTPIEVVLNYMSHMNFVVFYAYTAAKCVKPNVMQKACLRGMHYKCLNFHISNLINTETMQDGDFALIMWSTVFHLNYYLSFKLCKWKLFVCLFVFCHSN